MQHEKAGSLEKLLTTAKQPFEDLINIIDGSSAGIICALNSDGIYIQHNQITDLTINKYELPYNYLIGKSILDMTPENTRHIAQHYLNCAKKCIDADRIFIEDSTLSTTGKVYNDLFYYGPLKNTQGQTIGAISHMLDVKMLITVTTRLVHTYQKSNKSNQIINSIKSYFKEPIKEILILANLLEIDLDNKHKKSIIDEMKIYLKSLLKQIR